MTSRSARAQDRVDRLAAWWAGAWRWVLIAMGAAVAITVLLGSNKALTTQSASGVTMAVVVALLAIGAALTAARPLAIALMAMPALFVVQRIGGGGSTLTVSDAALAAAFGTAVLLGTRPFSRELRALLWLNAIYQFATLITVLVNPYVQNTVEWFHAWLLISGALVVGWALGRAGHAGLAFKLMVATGCALAAITIVAGLVKFAHGDFTGVYPPWPYPMHKNFAGTAMAFAALIVYVNPPWAALTRRWARISLTVLVIGVLFTQSRQAIIGLIIAVVIVAWRGRTTGHSRWVLLLLIPATWLVILTVSDQVQSQNKFNSFFQRLNWVREVYAYWKHSPIFGHGLRFWYVDPILPYQPPQGELEVLAESGVVGLAAFVLMWVGVLIVLWRMDPLYGALAVTAVASRIVQAQFDLFWVAAQVSIPFVIAGICVGAKALADANTAAAGRAAGLDFRMRAGPPIQHAVSQPRRAAR
ncbi:O-antigen ligase family protein [Rathayibacter soli]|uniref:O-antigen ligase family protein n=1 Tax=Rathayibacter soli TaxID=3144168 RepID=UPI0027E4C4AD|nr:O-antigen ligase family protein [Glaciibacter superstes]